MRKATIFLFAVVFLAAAVLFMAPPAMSKDTGHRLKECVTGYKTIRFGMSAEDALKEVEKLTGNKAYYMSQQGIITSAYNILDMGCILTVVVDSKKEIKSILIMFLERHTNPSLYHDDYKRVQEALQQKYGPPSTSVNINTNDNQFIDWGTALLTGYVTLTEQWYEGKTFERSQCVITHKLSGDNSKASHFVLFGDLARKKSDNKESPF